jgi:hypothetical protein
MGLGQSEFISVRTKEKMNVLLKKRVDPHQHPELSWCHMEFEGSHYLVIRIY